MSKEQELFVSIGESLEDATQGKLFGKPCFKINGKAFVCFFQDQMVLKLKGVDHKAASALKGSQLFDPSGKSRPMKEWVQVSYDHKKKWKGLAMVAMAYVIELNK